MARLGTGDPGRRSGGWSRLGTSRNAPDCYLWGRSGVLACAPFPSDLSAKG